MGRFADRAQRARLAAALSASRTAEARYVRELKRYVQAWRRAYLSVPLPHRTDAITPHGSHLDVVDKSIVEDIPSAVGKMFDRMSNTVRKQPFPKLFGIKPSDTRVAGQIAVARDKNIKLVEDAHREYASKVRKVINDPTNFGLRVEEVQKLLPDCEGRAELIARDQTLKLNGQINQTRQENAGVTSYIWSTSKDERVRPMHQDLEGTEQDWNDPPITAEDGSVNHPGQDYSCRCVGLPIVEELEGLDL